MVDKIYLDMDGCIADFSKRFLELYGFNPYDVTDKVFYKYFDDFIETEQFATLDFLHGAEELIKYLSMLDIPTEILSSTATEKHHHNISKQKKTWLESKNITFPTNFVPGKKHKYKYAASRHLIIDDTESIIKDWEKAGGLTVWYKDHDSTMKQLAKYTKNFVIA